jgi:hypothetical protein
MIVPALMPLMSLNISKRLFINIVVRVIPPPMNPDANVIVAIRKTADVLVLALLNLHAHLPVPALAPATLTAKNALSKISTTITATAS